MKISPHEWTECKLNDVLVECRGGAWGETSELPNVGVIRTTNISATHKLDLKDVAWRKLPANQLERQKLSHGDVIMTKSNSIDRVGACGLFWQPRNDTRTYISANFCQLLRFNANKVDPEYGFYWMTAGHTQQRLKSVATGTSSSLQNINGSKIKAVEISFPPLDEQRRIVGRIKECLSRVEEIVNLRGKSLCEREHLLESVIEAEYQAVNGKPVMLSDVCSIISPLVDPRESHFRDLLHVGGANIESSTGKLINLKMASEEKLKSSKFTFDERMVLYNKIRPYLKKIAKPLFKGLCSADMYPLLPAEQKLLREYLFFLLFSRSFTQYAIDGSNRAGMPKVNRSHLFSYTFKLPSLDQQKRTARRLDSAFRAVEQIRDDMQSTALEVHSLRESILRKAFAGEL